jgi:hypothetical protein
MLSVVNHEDIASARCALTWQDPPHAPDEVHLLRNERQTLKSRAWPFRQACWVGVRVEKYAEKRAGGGTQSVSEQRLPPEAQLTGS